MSIQSICVYCGSSNKVDEKYKQLARDVGKMLATQKMKVVYGGGHVGLMGLLADSCLAADGKITGIIPEHIKAHEIQHTGLSELIVVDSMHERKSLMAEKSDAFVVLPGGFGTLDETFEILTWKQLSLHNKPIIFYNLDGFWDPLLNFIETLVVTRFAPEANRRIFKAVTTTDELLAALLTPEEKMEAPEDKWK